MFIKVCVDSNWLKPVRSNVEAGFIEVSFTSRLVVFRAHRRAFKVKICFLCLGYRNKGFPLLFVSIT